MTTDAQTQSQQDQKTLPPFSTELLPEPYRTDPAFQSFKDWDGLLKSYKHASSMTGVDKNHVFKIPMDGNLEQVWKQLGMPDKPDGYKIPTELKSGLSDNFKTTFLDAAYKANLTADQFQSMVNFVDAARVAEAQAITESATRARQTAEAALKSALGEAHDQNINLAKDAVETYGTKGLWEKLDKAGLTTDVDIVNFLTEIGKLSQGEDGIVNGTQESHDFKQTPAQAQADINAILADPTQRKAYFDKSDPAHKQVMEKMTRLYTSVYGSAAVA